MVEKIGALFVMLLVMIGTAYAGADKEIASEEKGILQGKVTIGPLCPVEPCNLLPEQIAKVYEARKVIVYEQSTKMKITKVNLNRDGEYSVSLKPGKYIVDVTDAKGNELPLDRPGVIRFGNVRYPGETEVKAGGKVELNFHIDTGIR